MPKTALEIIEEDRTRLHRLLATRDAQLRSVAKEVGIAFATLAGKPPFPDFTFEKVDFDRLAKEIGGHLAELLKRNAILKDAQERVRGFGERFWHRGAPGAQASGREEICLARAIDDNYVVWALVEWNRSADVWENVENGEEVEVLEYWLLPPSEDGWEQTWRRRSDPPAPAAALPHGEQMPNWRRKRS